MQKLLDRPQNPGLSNVLGALVSTLVAVGIIFGFAKYQWSESLQPMKDQFAVFARTLEDQGAASVETRIRLAVQEERTSWISSQVGWAAKEDRIK